MLINCIVSFSWLSAPPSWLGYRYSLAFFYRPLHFLSKWLTSLTWNHVAKFVEVFVNFLAFSKLIWRLNRPHTKESLSNLETSYFSTYSYLHLCHKQILILLEAMHRVPPSPRPHLQFGFSPPYARRKTGSPENRLNTSPLVFYG